MKQESVNSRHVFLIKMTFQEETMDEAVRRFPVVYDKCDKHFKGKPPVYDKLLALVYGRCHFFPVP